MIYKNCKEIDLSRAIICEINISIKNKRKDGNERVLNILEELSIKRWGLKIILGYTCKKLLQVTCKRI